MAQRDRAAVQVRPFEIEPRLANHRQRLHRECLVQFDHADIVELQPRHRERFRDRLYRTDPHDLGRHAGRGITHEASFRLRPNSRAFASDMTSAAAAPSLVCDALPAVTVPLAWKTGFSFARASSVRIRARAFVARNIDLSSPAVR